MFQKFSDPARRVVFFARYEAGRLGGANITTAHLLLGLLRENSRLVEPLLAPGRTFRDLTRETERAVSKGAKGAKVGTSVEMPLAEHAKMALTYADEESSRLLSSTIDVPHVLLGLLRTKGSKAANLLTEFGLKTDDVRLKVAESAVSPAQEPFGEVVSAFYGIEVRFDAAAENAPTVIAEYRSRMGVVQVDPLRVTQSNLPPRAESLVLEWAAARKDEIKAAWKTAKAGQRFLPIPPLE